MPALGLGTVVARESFESAVRTHTEQLRSRKLQELQENAIVSGSGSMPQAVVPSV